MIINKIKNLEIEKNNKNNMKIYKITNHIV